MSNHYKSSLFCVAIVFFTLILFSLCVSHLSSVVNYRIQGGVVVNGITVLALCDNNKWNELYDNQMVDSLIEKKGVGYDLHIIDNSVEQENTEVIKEVNEPLTESGVKEAVSTTDLTSEVPKDTLSDDSADSPIEDDSLEDKPTTVIHNPITNKPLPKKSKKSSKQKSLFRRNRHVNDTPKKKPKLTLDLNANITEPLDNHDYRLVFFTSAEVSKNYGDYKIRNHLRMYSLLQRTYRFKGLFFSNSPELVQFAKRLHIKTVSHYKTNPYKLPLIDNMFEVARKLFDSSYYGYINSDILISPSLFDALAICIKNVQLGILEDNHEIAGRVHETPTYNKIDISNMTTYLDYMETASKVMRPMRNQHSADYFIFPHAFNYSLMQPAVIARIKIDNFLLGLPHMPEVYHPPEEGKSMGGLIDTTFYVLGLHLGRDGYNHREKRDHFIDDDMYWNVKFVPNFRKTHASLVFSDFVFPYRNPFSNE